VAPALAKITSAVPKERRDPSPVQTATCGQAASAALALSMSIASISTAVILPEGPTSSAAISV
jgi:hypothetical protein